MFPDWFPPKPPLPITGKQNMIKMLMFIILLKHVFTNYIIHRIMHRNNDINLRFQPSLFLILETRSWNIWYKFLVFTYNGSLNSQPVAAKT